METKDIERLKKKTQSLGRNAEKTRQKLEET